jgi:hypothetical protein
VGNEDCFRLLVNFLKYVNRRLADVNEASLDLNELRECNIPLVAIEPEHIIEFRTCLGACPENRQIFIQSTSGFGTRPDHTPAQITQSQHKQA